MRFWDTSALIPLLLPETASPTCFSLFESGEDFFYWWATPVEIVSAIERVARSGALTNSDIAKARNGSVRLLAGGFEVSPSEQILSAAQLLVRLHGLKAADALQLSSALRSSSHVPSQLEFVCLDKNLREAALAEGATVLP